MRLEYVYRGLAHLKIKDKIFFRKSLCCILFMFVAFLFFYLYVYENQYFNDNAGFKMSTMMCSLIMKIKIRTGIEVSISISIDHLLGVHITCDISLKLKIVNCSMIVL